ncbi:MAG: porin family protein [Brevundimonas sp.]|nr:MAG: porin family protein [Brevundimonas sp.]
MRTLILAAVAATAFAAPAMAQTVSSPQWYGTLGYGQVDDDFADLGTVTGRIGARFTPYLGAEAETSFGVADDKKDFGAVNGVVRHRYDAAAYAVATLPVAQNWSMFGRVGYGVTELQSEAAGVQSSDHQTSVNYGAGVNYDFDARNGVRADFTRRDYTDDAGKADVYSVNYVRRF